MKLSMSPVMTTTQNRCSMGRFSVPDAPFKDIATDFTNMRTQNKGIPISTGNGGQIHRMGGSDSL